MKYRISFLLLLLPAVLFAQNFQPTWESVDSRPIPTWFEDAKFGIFIHWGLYSVPSYSPTERDGVGVYERYSEHYWRRLFAGESKVGKYFVDFHNRVYGEDFTYQDFAPLFKAELFNPDEWADVFVESGAKYVVLTSKHHDGFTLWPSQYSWNWNTVDLGPHADLCGELSEAVKDKGLKMGFYYSLLEWYHPLFQKNTMDEYVDRHMLPQMKELVTKYSPDVLWTDGEWNYPSTTWKSPSFLAWLYNESPAKNTIVVNDRWGDETRVKHGGYYTTEYDLIHDGDASGVKFDKPWEECRGIAGSFGYNRRENLEDYSSSEELVHILINKVARGGNLLLNIGPTADGRIPVIMQQRLADIGAWLNVNGEAIYESRKWENAPNVTPETTHYFTKKGNDLYLIVTKWQETPITVSGIKRAENVSLLGLDEKISYQKKSGQLKIYPPKMNPSKNPCDYAWVYKISGSLK